MNITIEGIDVNHAVGLRKKALFIINPKAGNTRAVSVIAPTVEALCSSDYAPLVFTTSGRGDATVLAEKYAPDADLLVCCGGDGTINEVVRGLMRLDEKQRPIIGYIPAGSTNDFASALGLPKRMDMLIDNAINGTPMSVDVGCFNGRHYAYLASFGAFTDIGYSTSQNAKNALGFLAYLGNSMSSISNIRPIHTSVTINGETLSDNFAFVAISNTRSVAKLINYNDESIDLNDGLFEVILINYPENAIELGKIVRAITAADFDCEYIRRFTASEAKFVLDDPVAWMLDGEYAQGGYEVTIQNVHSAIRILVPPDVLLGEKRKHKH